MELGKRVRPLVGRLGARVSNDTLLALAFAAAGELEAVVRSGGQPGQLMVASGTGPSLGLALAFRRSRPLLAMTLFAVGGAVGTVLQALLPPGGPGSADAVVPIFALLVLTYSLGAHGTRLQLVLGSIQPLLLIVVVDLLQHTSYSVWSALPFFALFVVGVPALAGRLVRARLILVSQLREQERQIDAERAAHTGAELAIERLELAERLHEKLVAGMESLLAQVAVAQHSFGRRQAEAVATIEARARALLAETRKVVVSLASANPGDGVAHSQHPPERGQPRRRILEARKDAVLPWTALAAAALCVGLLIEIRATPHVRVPMPIAVLGCFVIAAPLALTWSRPLLMTAWLWAAAALFSLLVTPLAAIFAAISMWFLPPFMVAFFENRTRALLGLGICCLGVLACFGLDSFPDDAAFMLCAWIAGRVLSTRSRLVEELRFNNRWLAEQREAASRQAVLEERARVARELHDAIGHSLTVIALQAGAARRMWMADHERAETALGTIARAAAAGLAELRMGFSSSQFIAQAGQERARLADVEALLDGARGAGLSVSLHIDGEQPVLAADTERAAFRVLQEALTNVLKHAPGATAEVTFRNAGPRVELVVANSASDQPSLDSGDGSHGLSGMHQRVQGCGGRLDWGRRPDGGFEVRAEFPAETVRA
jgi:signal transduction histidine kinase